MRYLYSIILLFCFHIAAAQQTETITGRVELNVGKSAANSTIYPPGSSHQVHLYDIRVMNGFTLTSRRMNIPAVFTIATDTRKLNRYPWDYSGQLKVFVLDISEQGEELNIDIEVRMDGNVVSRRRSYLLVPELSGTDGNNVTGAALLISGWVKQQLQRRHETLSEIVHPAPTGLNINVVEVSDTLVRYNMRMPYQMWMDDATLEIHQVVSSTGGEERTFTLTSPGRVKLQKREAYQVSPRVNYIMPEREEKSRKMQGQAFLDFPIGRSIIAPEYRRNPEELAKIQTAIRKVQTDPDVNIIGLYIEGYASPEGSYTSNEKLARERSTALSDYIARNFGVQSGIIRTSSVAEDWDGLRVLVEESSISRRDDILAIIDGPDDPDRKEQRLRALGAPWQAMLNTMFPQLRRVEYQIDFTVKDYSLEESRNLATRNPEMLSQRELYQLAQSYEQGTTDWERTLETIIRLYPDDATAINNYAGLLLMRGELTSAKRYLDRIADRPETANNLGAYYLLTGELDTAERYLSQARDAGVNVSVHNLEELERKRENKKLMERYEK